MHVIVGVSPYSHCAEAKKLQDPQGISSANAIVSIADHSHIIFVWGSRGVTLENRHQSLPYKIYGDKSADRALLLEHVIISYLFWSVLVWLHFEQCADYNIIVNNYESCPQTPPSRPRHWPRKGVWPPGRPLLEVKLYWEVRSGPTNPSVIVNWEVVRSSEVRNVLSLWQIQSVP